MNLPYGSGGEEDLKYKARLKGEENLGITITNNTNINSGIKPYSNLPPTSSILLGSGSKVNKDILPTNNNSATPLLTNGPKNIIVINDFEKLPQKIFKQILNDFLRRTK